MSLTWKDAVATVIVAAVVAVTYAQIKTLDWPLIQSWRMGTLVLLILGLGTCIFIGSDSSLTKNAWTTTGTILGGLAAGLAVAGLAANSKLIFLLLAGDIILLWVITTLHHVVGK